MASKQTQKPKASETSTLTTTASPEPQSKAPAIDIGIPQEDRQKIAQSLSVFLADAYTLYLKTHNFHWNVTGPMFNALHNMFEEQYTEQWNALDDVAERIDHAVEPVLERIKQELGKSILNVSGRLVGVGIGNAPGFLCGFCQSRQPALAQLVPKTALLEVDGETREVPAESIRIGQSVLVRPGDRVNIVSNTRYEWVTLDLGILGKARAEVHRGGAVDPVHGRRRWRPGCGRQRRHPGP